MGRSGDRLQAGTATGVAPTQLLVVEDDAAFARALARALGREKYVVEHASTLAQGRFLLAARAFDVLVLDIELPDGDGVDLARELRRAESTIAIVVMSGHIDGRIALELIDLQAFALPKPADSVTIREAVARAASPRQSLYIDVRAFAARYGLSDRETTVLLGAIAGMDAHTQAASLVCSAGTLATFWHRILKKCAASSQRDVLAAVIRYAENRRLFDARHDEDNSSDAPSGTGGDDAGSPER